jgi:hypothetical protein
VLDRVLALESATPRPPAAPKAAKAPSSGMNALQAAIGHMVSERVKAAIETAIQALRATAC